MIMQEYGILTDEERRRINEINARIRTLQAKITNIRIRNISQAQKSRLIQPLQNQIRLLRNQITQIRREERLREQIGRRVHRERRGRRMQRERGGRRIHRERGVRRGERRQDLLHILPISISPIIEKEEGIKKEKHILPIPSSREVKEETTEEVIQRIIERIINILQRRGISRQERGELQGLNIEENSILSNGENINNFISIEEEEFLYPERVAGAIFTKIPQVQYLVDTSTYGEIEDQGSPLAPIATGGVMNTVTPMSCKKICYPSTMKMDINKRKLKSELIGSPTTPSISVEIPEF